MYHCGKTFISVRSTPFRCRRHRASAVSELCPTAFVRPNIGPKTIWGWLVPDIDRGHSTIDEIAVQRVKRYYDLVDLGDVDGLVDLFAEEAVYSRPGYPLLHGKKSIRIFYREQRVIRFGSHELTSIVARSPNVAVQGRFVGTLKNGDSVHAGFADFFDVGADGRITRRDTYFFTPLV